MKRYKSQNVEHKHNFAGDEMTKRTMNKVGRLRRIGPDKGGHYEVSG